MFRGVGGGVGNKERYTKGNVDRGEASECSVQRFVCVVLVLVQPVC
jgi:hypothetical protein